MNIDRPRLLSKLDTQDHGVTLLIAGGGFGKTALLESWQARAIVPVAWVDVRPEHDDPASFFSCLAGAIQRATGAAAIAGDTPHALLERAASNGPFAIVLDDFDRAKSDTFVRLVATLVDRRVEGVRFVIAARETPRLPLARRRVRGEVLVIGEPELRFSVDEIALISAASGRGREIDAVLVEATMGWPLGVRLALRALSRGASAADLISGRTTMLELALALEAPRVRELLRCAAVVDRLDASFACAFDVDASMLESLAADRLYLRPAMEDPTFYVPSRFIQELELLEAPAPATPDRDAATSRAAGPLGHRERDVLKHLVDGYSIREIASFMAVKRETARTHARRVFKKLGVRSRSAAVARACELFPDISPACMILPRAS